MENKKMIEDHNEEEEEENFQFINELEFYNEIIGYRSVVNYQEIFNNMEEQTKQDLEREVLFYYTYFTENAMTSINMDVNNKKINTMNFDIEMYTYPITSNTSRIGVQIFLRDNASPLQYLAYIAPYNLKNFPSSPLQMNTFKEYLYSTLFLIHVFCTEFQYHPMLVYMYHKDDIPPMTDIKLRRARLFGDDLECSVCLEKTVMMTSCNHSLCHICFSKLRIKNCPLCRSLLEHQYYVLEPPNQILE